MSRRNSLHDGDEDGFAAGVGLGERLAELADAGGNLLGCNQDLADLAAHWTALAPRDETGAAVSSARMARAARYGLPGIAVRNVPRNVPASDTVIAHGSIICR